MHHLARGKPKDSTAILHFLAIKRSTEVSTIVTFDFLIRHQLAIGRREETYVLRALHLEKEVGFVIEMKGRCNIRRGEYECHRYPGHVLAQRKVRQTFKLGCNDIENLSILGVVRLHPNQLDPCAVFA